MMIHPASAVADQMPAIRKNGRKPIVQIANGLLFAFSTAGMAMRHPLIVPPDHTSQRIVNARVAGRREWYPRYSNVRLR
jgi:hypothetical protein